MPGSSQFFRKPTGCLIIALVGLMIIVGALFLAEKSLKATVLVLAEDKVQSMATEAIHEAIRRHIGAAGGSKELVFYKTDQEGRIVLVQPDTLRIQQMAAETTLEIQKTLNQLPLTELTIPLGHVTGTRLLAHSGPAIPVTMLPIGYVKVSARETFEDAGINQTKYVVNLDIEARMRVALPLVSSELPVITQVPVATTIINGDVPNVYLQGAVTIPPGGIVQQPGSQ